MLARLFAGASIAWLAILGIAAALPPDSTIAGGVFRFASYVCHQQPDRSFHWSGTQWAVCARCLGLYAAAPAGALAALFARALPGPRARNFLLLCIAGLPTFVTWAGEHLLGWPVTNAVRFAAALPLGTAVAFIIVSTVQYTLPDARRG